MRGQVENTNLRANNNGKSVTHAESFKTCQTEAFFGREYVNTIERLNDKVERDGSGQVFLVDRRNPRKKQVTIKDVSTLYGQRPQVPDLWFLSPYDFVSEWEPVLVSYPTSLRNMHDSKYHAFLTESGVAKLRAQEHGEEVEMLGGEDYVVKEGGEDWYAYPKEPSTEHFRHTWVIQRRMRPKAPSFAGAPLPRHAAGETERAAMIVMAYYHPWTLRLGEDFPEHVPHASALRPAELTWQESLENWFNGRILSETAKKNVGNFLSVHRVRPGGENEDCGADEDFVSDEELELQDIDLTDVLQTRVGGRDAKDAQTLR